MKTNITMGVKNTIRQYFNLNKNQINTINKQNLYTDLLQIIQTHSIFKIDVEIEQFQKKLQYKSKTTQKIIRDFFSGFHQERDARAMINQIFEEIEKNPNINISASEYNLECVKEDGLTLKFINEQTPEICLVAVKQNGFALEYVKVQTPEICLEAVKQKGWALEDVNEQTPEICLVAVKQNGGALLYVKNRTPEICLEAVKENGYALKYVKNQTPEICLEAVKENGGALKFINEQTPETCLVAVKQNGFALEYVKVQTPEICLEAVKQNGWALQYVKEQTPEICMAAVKENSKTLQFVSPQFQPLFEPLTIGDKGLSIKERYALRTSKTLELKGVLDKKGNKRDVVVKMDNEGKIKIYPPISISQKQENKQTTKNRMKF